MNDPHFTYRTANWLNPLNHSMLYIENRFVALSTG